MKNEELKYSAADAGAAQCAADTGARTISHSPSVYRGSTPARGEGVLRGKGVISINSHSPALKGTPSISFRRVKMLPLLLLTATLFLTLGACRDDDYGTNPDANPNTGRLSLTSVSLDGLDALSAETRSANTRSTDTRSGAQTRIATEDGGTTTPGTSTGPDGTIVYSLPANTAITGITDGDRVALRYNFAGTSFGGYDFSKDAGSSSGSGTGDSSETPAKYLTTASYTAGTPGSWTMGAANDATNPLRPNADRGNTSGSTTATESWVQAQALLWLAATPNAVTAEEAATGSEALGGLTDGSSTVQTAPCGMNYRGSKSGSDVSIPGITDKKYPVRLYADALVAHSSSGQLSIDRNPDSPTLGAIQANLAHPGAMMRLKPEDIQIDGDIITDGQVLTDATLSALWVEVTVSRSSMGADGSPEVAADETFFVPFSRVTPASDGTSGGTSDGTSTPVWQAIIPGSAEAEDAGGNFIAGISVRVKRFVAQVTGNSPAPTVTFVLKQTNGSGSEAATGKLLSANLRYPLKLNISTQSTVTFTLPDGKPGWGDEGDEGELANWGKHLEVNYSDDTPDDGANNGTYTYTVKTTQGLQRVANWMNNGGTPPAQPSGAPSYDSNDAGTETGKAAIAGRMKTNITLAADLDLSGSATDASGSNWMPIGTNSNPYTGTFDGKEYTVSGLKIDRPGAEYQGFFGRIGKNSSTPATVRSLTVEGSVKGREYVGGIVGQNYYSLVENCISRVEVEGTGSAAEVGGVAGYNLSGTLTACYATAKVSGGGNSANVGGVAGYNLSGTLIACYATGEVSGSETGARVGGVAGGNNQGTLIACYATGEVSGSGNNANVGGVAGYTYSSTLTACYATAKVSGSGNNANVGGVAGGNYYGTLTACYATATVSGGGNSANVGSLVGFNSASSPLTACFYQWNVNIVSGAATQVGIGYCNDASVQKSLIASDGSNGIAGDGTAINSGLGNIIFSPVGNTELSGYEHASWDLVVGTYSTGDTGTGTLNAAITEWNNTHGSGDGKHCPYHFEANPDAATAPDGTTITGGMGTTPLILVKNN